MECTIYDLPVSRHTLACWIAWLTHIATGLLTTRHQSANRLQATFFFAALEQWCGPQLFGDRPCSWRAPGRRIPDTNHAMLKLKQIRFVRRKSYEALDTGIFPDFQCFGPGWRVVSSALRIWSCSACLGAWKSWRCIVVPHVLTTVAPCFWGVQPRQLSGSSNYMIVR